MILLRFLGIVLDVLLMVVLAPAALVVDLVTYPVRLGWYYYKQRKVLNNFNKRLQGRR